MSLLHSLSLFQTVLVLGGTVVGLALWVAVAWRLRASLLLGVAMIAAVLQGFVPYGYVSWALLLTLAMAPAAVRRAQRSDYGAWFWVVVGIGVVQGASLLWSPTFGAVIHAGLSSAVLLVVYLLWRSHLRSDEPLERPLMIAAPLLWIFSALVLAFRFVPALERAYLDSPLARLLSEPGVELIPTGRYPNVIDPDKAGGLMLNGNAASLMLALVAVLFGWAALSTAGRARTVLGATAGGAFLAVFATGSKTPLFLVLLVAFATAVIVIARRSAPRAALVGIVAAALATAALWIGAATGSALVQQSYETLFGRTKYWLIAALEFPRHWLLGLGYGGWEAALQENWNSLWGETSAYQGYPAHNFILQAWSDGGILLALLVLAASALPLWWAGQDLFHTEGSWRSPQIATRILLFAGAAWAPLHSLTDTTAFFGENHSLPFYGAIIAIITATRVTRATRRQAEHGESDGGSATTRAELRAARPR